CYVKYIKIRVLTSHTMEGYAMCTLTRVQIFGSTMIQSIGKLQKRYEVQKHPAAFISAEKMELATEQSLKSLNECPHIHSNGSSISSQYDEFRFPGTKQPSGQHSETISKPWRAGDNSSVGDGQDGNDTAESVTEGPPLLKFIEEMTELEANYHNLATNVNTLLSDLKYYEQDISEIKRHTGSGGRYPELGGSSVLDIFTGLDTNTVIKLLVLMVVFLTISQIYLAYRLATGGSIATSKAAVNGSPNRPRKHRKRNRKRIMVSPPIPSDGFASA
ncbi:hypothetical protein FOZ63_015765, partial [Perkinsus olseni]